MTQNSFVMNSASLQRHFSDVYKHFFGNYEIVTSNPMSFNWGCGGDVIAKWIFISQKIPLKAYVGIKTRTDKKIVRDDCLDFDVSKNIFVQVGELVGRDNTKLITTIREFLDTHGYTRWINIWALLESPRWPGYVHSTFTMSALATALYTLVGVQKTKEIEDQKLIESIFTLANELNLALYNDNLNSDCLCLAFERTNQPFLYLPLSGFSGVALHAFVNANPQPSFDHGQLFGGLVFDFAHSQEITQTFSQDNASIANSIHMLFDKKVKKADLTKLFGEEINDGFAHMHEQFLYYLKAKMLNTLTQLFHKPQDQALVDATIATMNDFSRLSETILWENKLFTTIRYLFDKYKHYEDEKIGLYQYMSWHGGGNIQFILKYKKSRETLIKVIQEVTKENPNSLFLGYASRRDGDTADAIQVEQAVRQWILSHFLDQNVYSYHDNQGATFFGSLEDIKTHYGNGIIFDAVHGSMYVKNRQLTSKDIPSQNYTIELFTVLLDNQWKPVSNRELPVSSYSQWRNQMSSKILIPLQELATREFNKNLAIDCTGSLGQFVITLTEDLIPLGIIKKIQE